MLTKKTAHYSAQFNQLLSSPRRPVRRWLLVFLILLVSSVLVIQTTRAVPMAPEGVIDPNLQLWLKADAATSTTVDGAGITAWTDQSSNGYVASAFIGPPATYQSDELNGNPVVRFEGLTGLELPTNLNLVGTNDFTMFVVGNYSGANPINPFIGPQTAVSGAIQYRVDSTEGLAPNATVLASSNITDVVLASSAILTNKTPFLGGITRSGNGFTHTLAGASDTTLTSSYSFAADNLRIGASYEDALKGDLAEIIVYDRALSDIERSQIDSYLALKYGLTLAGGVDYVDSTGTVIWDAAGNTDYHNDIAGIGSDEGIPFTQTRSRSSNANSITSIFSPTNLIDGNYIIWGHDNGLLTGSTNVPPYYAQRLNRVWRVQETGDSGL